MICVESADRDNPRLGPEYPYITHWRCPVCWLSYRIAEAKAREWCMEDFSPLMLLTQPQIGATCDRPALQRMPK